MAKFILLKVIEEPSDNAGGCLGALAVIGFAIYFIISGIGSCITDREVYSYNSELVEKTIKDTNALINSKERLTLEQCLVYVQFETRCIVDDNLNFIPKPLSIFPWAPCPNPASGRDKKQNKEIKERCSAQKDAIQCENNYDSYCNYCKYRSECRIEDNSFVMHDKYFPCSKELKNSLSQTIMINCIELVYREHYKNGNFSPIDFKDPLWNGDENDDGEKKHNSFDHFDNHAYRKLFDLYEKLTGRKLN